ncbi:MAG: type II toxin-antitoxin system PemK/MazF family toxin [Prolixibacteraceae bacterium]|nr:type II toxin-antitoxin system PemK/MazF family toxin [Prolixibacteraceae bacterium]
MAFEIWDVVTVPAFPNQENSKLSTTRPCIIIEDLQNQVVICPITKQLTQQNRYKFCFVVEKDSLEGKAMGLSFDSLIVVDREAVLEKVRLHRKIGECPDSIIERIEDLLKEKK